MKLTILFLLLVCSFFILNSCNNNETPRGSLALTGRILTDCETMSPIKGIEVQLWNDKRVNGNGDTLPEKMVATTVTGGNGNFSFIQDWDTFPRSLRAKKNNQSFIISQGVFGNYALENTYNSSVADLLLNGNNANILFEIFRPNSWQAGDSAIIRIESPYQTPPYVKVIYDIPGTLLDTVNNVKAFNRIMQTDKSKTDLNRRFTFKAQIVWVLGGVSNMVTYIVPTNTCSKALIVYPIHY
jgi:hypothetical protein